jgi:hypothetical protein
VFVAGSTSRQSRLGRLAITTRFTKPSTWAPYRGNDSNWREGQLQKTTEEVAWREQLLEQLLG